MKVTLDLSKLLEQGKITPADAERLKALAAHETGNLGLNILTGFGVIAASAGAVAFLLTAFSFTPLSAAGIGAVAFALGLSLLLLQGEVWRLLSQTLIVIGGLTGAAGLFILDQRLAAGGAAGHRDLRADRDPGAFEPDGGVVGAVAGGKSRRPHRLCARGVFAVDPGARGHHHCCSPRWRWCSI